MTNPMAARDAPPATKFSVLLSLGNALPEALFVSDRSVPLLILRRARSVLASFKTVKYMAAPGTFLQPIQLKGRNKCQQLLVCCFRTGRK